MTENEKTGKKHFKITFSGRVKGAIGINSNFCESSYGDNPHDAVINLYERFDHIYVDNIIDMETQERVFEEKRRPKP